MNFYFITYWFYVFESLACCMIDVSEIENALNELNMILIYYEMDFSRSHKFGMYFKVLLSIKFDFFLNYVL